MVVVVHHGKTCLSRHVRKQKLDQLAGWGDDGVEGELVQLQSLKNGGQACVNGPELLS